MHSSLFLLLASVHLSSVLTVTPLPECRKGENCFESLNIFVREEFMSIRGFVGTEEYLCFFPFGFPSLVYYKSIQGSIYWVNVVSREVLRDMLFTVLNHDV